MSVRPSHLKFDRLYRLSDFNDTSHFCVQNYDTTDEFENICYLLLNKGQSEMTPNRVLLDLAWSGW